MSPDVQEKLLHELEDAKLAKVGFNCILLKSCKALFIAGHLSAKTAKSAKFFIERKIHPLK